jgi:hypothetical protein|tara:strand:- start:102 stop:335 length:234 start_codon:yes stop_codon:yes gene_type:complete
MKLLIEAKNKSQMVLAHLKHYGSITTWEAITQYKATRLSAIIFNLRGKGYNIESLDKEGDGCRFVEYILHEKREDAV